MEHTGQNGPRHGKLSRGGSASIRECIDPNFTMSSPALHKSTIVLSSKPIQPYEHLYNLIHFLAWRLSSFYLLEYSMIDISISTAGLSNLSKSFAFV